MGLDEFVKEQQSSLVFDCSTSTSIASKVLSLLALDTVDSLNLSRSTSQGCTGDAVQTVSPLKNITTRKSQTTFVYSLIENPKNLASDGTTVEGILAGTLLACKSCS